MNMNKKNLKVILKKLAILKKNGLFKISKKIALQIEIHRL